MDESNTTVSNEGVVETVVESTLPVVEEKVEEVKVEETPVIEVESAEEMVDVPVINMDLSAVKKYSGKRVLSYENGVVTLETGEKMNLSQEEYDAIDYVAG